VEVRLLGSTMMELGMSLSKHTLCFSLEQLLSGLVQIGGLTLVFAMLSALYGEAVMAGGETVAEVVTVFMCKLMLVDETPCPMLLTVGYLFVFVASSLRSSLSPTSQYVVILPLPWVEIMTQNEIQLTINFKFNKEI